MDLVKCPFCGKEIENDSFYCDQCGEELKVCPTGHGFKKGKVCSDCGTKLVEAKNAQNSPAPQPASQPANVQAQMPTPTPVTASPSVSPSVTTPPTAQQTSPASQPDTAERTVRPVAAPAEPNYLVSASLNARLALKDGAIIGRRTGDYVHVFGNQGYISGTHARIQRNATGIWEIVDLDSSNGTFLNGQKLAPNQPAAIKIGDTVAFYDLKFTVSE